ncbi:MAG TPA: hypothetical protein VMV49_01395 [Candidatus Deferrimicrobium sp.]|nr:hypothetical protein [Candidatus Deferrimicrobium sp.]
MRANLHSRENVRIKWFDLKDIPFLIERKLEISYSTSSVEDNVNTYTLSFQYFFKEVENTQIPLSDIIIFENSLPATYAKTAGSKGNKFFTEPQSDSIVLVTDRIVELIKGKEDITREPPTYPNPRIKEIEVREREDTVKRKITFKNELNEQIEHVELKLVETKDVRFLDANPAPLKKDPPEYIWTFSIDPETTYSIELKIHTHIRKTFEIEKEPPPKAQ